MSNFYNSHTFTKVVLQNKGRVIKPSAKFHFRILKSKLLLLPLESTSHPQIFALFIISPLSNFCRVQMYVSFLELIRLKLNIQIHTYFSIDRFWYITVPSFIFSNLSS